MSKQNKQCKKTTNIRLRQHYEEILDLAADRVLLLIEARLRAFASYNDFMTRMSLVISSQQSILNSPGLNELALIALRQSKGAWELASSLSQRAGRSLSVLHDRSKKFVRLYRKAEEEIGEQAVSAILDKMNNDAKVEAEWYRLQWGEFLYWIRMAGLPHKFMIGNLGSERVVPAALSEFSNFQAHFDEIKGIWVGHVDGS